MGLFDILNKGLDVYEKSEDIRNKYTPMIENTADRKTQLPVLFSTSGGDGENPIFNTTSILLIAGLLAVVVFFGMRN